MYLNKMAFDLNALLSSTDSNRDNSKYLEILKEMFNKDKLTLLSELDDNEIKVFSRLAFLSQLLDKKYRRYMKGKKTILDVENFMKKYLELRISKNRKSRGEFVSGVTGERAGTIEKSLLRNNAMDRILR